MLHALFARALRGLRLVVTFYVIAALLCFCLAIAALHFGASEIEASAIAFLAWPGTALAMWAERFFRANGRKHPE